VIRVVAIVAAGVAALAAPAFASAYPWPLKPFDRQHPVRGGFCDPRLRPDGDPATGAFHFGVDIVAADGTPVYSVSEGTVFRRHGAVAVREPGGHEFSYWHVDTVVGEHSFVRAGDLLGYVAQGWGHVHFAESDAQGYLNPLRPGALEPFSDSTTPVVTAIDVTAAGGRLDATAEAYDPPPITPPPPWQEARLAPAVVRWRLLLDGAEVLPWTTAADFRTVWPAPQRFAEVYAPGTTQNHPGSPGRYVFWLAHGRDLASLPDGAYVLQVEARDASGNTGSASTAFELTGQSRTTRKTASR
jgi:hypothetical protein